MENSETQKNRQPILHEFIDDSVGLRAYIVIDSLRNGQSCGGLRISDDLTIEEIKALARGMTFKYCFLKENMGGAKSGIKIPKDCTIEQRTKIIEAFGRHASSILKNTYTIWSDLGSSADDITKILNAAGCEYHEISDSAYFTALTVVSALKAACEVKSIRLSTVSVTIEGFGSVGMNIASELAKFGVKIIGVSTVNGTLYDKGGLDINKLIDLKKKYKDDLVHYYGTEFLKTKELLFKMKTDIFIPCARTWSINAANMKNINAKIIVPGANVPLTNEAEKFLHEKGILCLPDFICNIGGVLGTSLYDDGNRISTVHRFIMNEFGQLVKELVWKSISNNSLPSEIAKSVAKKNCNTNIQGMQKKSFMKKIVNIWFHRVIRLQRFPGLRAQISLQRKKKILKENIRCIKNKC